jgi:hypothetical protein
MALHFKNDEELKAHWKKVNKLTKSLRKTWPLFLADLKEHGLDDIYNLFMERVFQDPGSKTGYEKGHPEINADFKLDPNIVWIHCHYSDILKYDNKWKPYFEKHFPGKTLEIDY